MAGVSKPTLIEEQSFPFESSISYGVEEGFHELHWHSEIEICYIRSGTGKYLINGIDYPFQAGDLFIISNDDIHLCYDDRDLVMQVVMFDTCFIGGGSANPLDFECMRLLVDALYSQHKKIDHTQDRAGELAAVLTELQREYEAMEKGYEMMIKSLLLRFFALVFRNISTAAEADRGVGRSAVHKIRSVLLYMDKHYHEPMNLSMLAEKFSVSRPYLCSAFKSLTGISPMEYIIRKRITHAKHLLVSTDKSVLSISEECGFCSLSNFNSQFKRMTGSTPSGYRKLQ